MAPDLVSSVLIEPRRVRDFDVAAWELLVRQGRQAFLLAKVYRRICQAGLEDEILAPAKQHFLAADTIARRHRLAVPLEVARLKQLLAKLKLELLLLKGAAYVAAELPAAQGRTFSDIDMLVPAEKLAPLENLLKIEGWIGEHQDAYDQQYYRKWMHEIPPLRHFRRGTCIDIHHTILPPTARYHPDPQQLRAQARTLASGVQVLCPIDMVIHSATHLFHEGEFEHGLRDLVDIAELINHFAIHEPGFWEQLVPRAEALDLVRPLYYGLHYAEKILAVQVPERVMRRAARGAPRAIMRAVMDWLFKRALRPNHVSCALPGSGLARWLLYVRSHYLRMPLYLLIPHLLRKAWKGQFQKQQEEPQGFIPGAGKAR